MDLTHLEYLGLTAGEIKVFQALLENGELSATKLVEKSGLKKGDCYNKAYDLVQKGFVVEYDKQKKKHFKLLDPRKLEEAATVQYQTALQAKREVEAVLPNILSTYALTYHRPGIVMFEGEEAQRRILEDSLTAEEDILQYVDLDIVLHHYPDLNAQYAKRRMQLKKKKRIIVSDNELSRSYAAKVQPEITDVRLINYPLPKFATVMQIYNNKTSYLTLKADGMIGVIIEDALIAQMHRALFEFTWQQAYAPGAK